MSVWQLVVREIRGRLLQFLLCLFAIAVAALLFIAGPTVLDGYARETEDQVASLREDTDKLLAEMDKKTTRIMRDLGVNLRIVHQDTNMGDFYSNFVAVDFPEDYVQKLAQAEQIETIVHLVATLRQKVTWNGQPVLIVGVDPVLTDSQKNAEKPHMVRGVAEGTVVVGHYLGIDRKEGDTLDILGHKFRIGTIRGETGTREDIALMLNLKDAQRVLDKAGKINEIMALNCKCQGDRLSVIRRELEGVLRDTKVTEYATRATAREQQRDLVEKKSAQQVALLEASRQRGAKTLAGITMVAIPSVVLASALFVGVLTWLNVRERRAEIGLLRALGKPSSTIAAMLLCKALFTGLCGGVVAWLISWGAYEVLHQVAGGAGAENGDGLSFTVSHFRPDTSVMLIALAGAPLVAAMASYLPMLLALRQDPAAILTDSEHRSETVRLPCPLAVV